MASWAAVTALTATRRFRRSHKHLGDDKRTSKAIPFNAGHLNEAVYRITSQSQVMLDSDFRSLEDDFWRSSHAGRKAGASHRTGNWEEQNFRIGGLIHEQGQPTTNFGLTTAFRSRNGATALSVFKFVFKLAQWSLNAQLTLNNIPTAAAVSKKVAMLFWGSSLTNCNVVRIRIRQLYREGV